jgi:hypothetical protein
MAVSSPISGAGKGTRAGTGSPAIPPLKVTAPSVALPFCFIMVGLVALCTGIAWLVARPELLAAYHYNQSIVAATHLFVLGWIGSIVMGAMYQLVPVALETRLYSERLAWLQFVLHCAGFIGMVWMFHAWNMKQVGHFGSVLGLGVALFVFNLSQTLRRVPKWSVVASGVVAALSWISFAVLAGLSIAAAKSFNDPDSANGSGSHGSFLLILLTWLATWVARFDPISTMHAHAHLGILGCFIMLIVGVSYKLVPMFTLSEIQNRARAVWSIAVLNIGLVASFLAILLRWRWRIACALLVILGLALYGFELAAILRARKRLAIDWGIKGFLTGIAMLVPLSVLGIMLSWPGLPLNPLTGQLENLYGFLAVIGLITPAIVGMLYKIIPFLVWFQSYSRQIGRARVPALADMYSAHLQMAGYWAYLLGLCTTSAGIVCASSAGIRIGCSLVALSLATFMLNVFSILSHLVKPKLKPFTAPTVGVKPAECV